MKVHIIKAGTKLIRQDDMGVLHALQTQASAASRLAKELKEEAGILERSIVEAVLGGARVVKPGRFTGGLDVQRGARRPAWKALFIEETSEEAAADVIANTDVPITTRFVVNVA